MKGFDLSLTLEEDSIFSEINATEGGHKGLDYIPGGALLGIAAAHLYSDIADTSLAENNPAFTLFHSGKVRFGNAYPMTANGQKTYPIPFCWHKAKGTEHIEHTEHTNNDAKGDGKKLRSAVIWCLHKCEEGKLPDQQQPQQLRDGYFALDGTLASADKSFRMKTAIDATKGKAKESALFGYDALNAGQCFYARIAIDDDVDDQWVKQLKTVFKQTLLLGRSRSAEYGKVYASIINQNMVNHHQDAEQSKPNTKITLWLQSDLAALDHYGQPTLLPSSQDLGLSSGRFVAEESFLRTRHYSTWNAHKRSPEMERQVIAKGSVLVYELDQPLTPTQRQTIAAGLGTERASGLGQVWLNPDLLKDKHPSFAPIKKASKASQSNRALASTYIVPDNPKTPLIVWLEKQNTQQQNHAVLYQQTKMIAKQYAHLLQSSCQLQGIECSIHTGPSLSQWGNVLDAAKKTGNLRFHLFDDEQGVCKVKAQGWKDDYWHQEQQAVETFYHWFKRVLGDDPDAKWVQRLVIEIMTLIKERGQLL